VEARSLFERALAIWESALGADHVNVASVLGNLARVDMIEARHVEAERRISRSLDIVERALGPDHPEVARRLAGLAELRGLEGDWKAARGLYERSLEVRWGRGSARQTGVIAVLEQFIDLRGLGLVSDAVRTDAVRRFEEAVAGASPGEDLYRAMAAVLEAEGRKEESQTVLARAVDRFPASRAVRYQLAESAAGLGRIGEAIELLEQARALDGEPQLERVLVREGDLHLDLDRLEEARAAYEGALAVNPGFTPARIGLGEVDFRSGRLEDALGEFAEAVLFDPDDAAAHYRIAEASLRLGRPVEAAAAASRAVELDPEERRARYIQGRALMEVGRIDEGQEAMAEYARLEERARAEHAGVLEVSAIERDVRVRVVAGELGEAIGLLESGVEDHPGAYWLALHLGLLQGASGRVETAVATFESMIERGLGDDPVIRRYLARAWEALGDASASERHEAMSLERLHAELESGLSH
jgi:tetratricopeptide (TPR) repeat protein